VVIGLSTLASQRYLDSKSAWYGVLSMFTLLTSILLVKMKIIQGFRTEPLLPVLESCHVISNQISELGMHDLHEIEFWYGYGYPILALPNMLFCIRSVSSW